MKFKLPPLNNPIPPPKPSLGPPKLNGRPGTIETHHGTRPDPAALGAVTPNLSKLLKPGVWHKGGGTLGEINRLINTLHSRDDVKAVFEMAKRRASILDAENICQLYVGQQVVFIKGNRRIDGEIVNINRTTASVRTLEGTTWRVSASLLQARG